MRVQLLSDLHTEFHADGGVAFVESLDPTDIDVLVLAGDIAVGAAIPKVMALFCEHYCDATVLYVHGNHEFYGGKRADTVESTRAAVLAQRNLHWLDCNSVEILGQRFLGTPLWFSHTEEVQRLRSHMGDFEHIREFERWIYEENARALRFLQDELREGDVVITHYLPSPNSIAPRFIDNPLNAFFLCDHHSLIVERKPALWLHGHTHSSMNYCIGPTRVACNPFGYVGRDENASFTEQAVFIV